MNAPDVSWSTLKTAAGNGQELPSLLAQLTAVEASEFGDAQNRAWELLGEAGELFDALPVFLERLLAASEDEGSLAALQRARLISLATELLAQGSGDKVATGLSTGEVAARYDSGVGHDALEVFTRRAAWFLGLLGDAAAPLRAAAIKALTFSATSTSAPEALRAVEGLATADEDESLRALALHCVGVLSRSVPEADVSSALDAVVKDETASVVLRACAFTGLISRDSSSFEGARSGLSTSDLLSAGLEQPPLDPDCFPLKAGLLHELLYECVCEATQSVQPMRALFLEKANDEGLSHDRRRFWFEQLFEKTLPSPADGYALAEDFTEPDLQLLHSLSERDYTEELRYAPGQWNPFHSVGVPAGLRARRRWLELESGGPYTRRVATPARGAKTSWTVWRHLLGCVDRDGDFSPKQQLEFVKRHLGPLGVLELLCDDVGSNAYDLRMIWGAREFALAAAESLASKASAEVVAWATERAEQLSKLSADALTSFQRTCDATLVLAPLAKSLRKGTYLSPDWIRLMGLSSRHPNLAKVVWGAFDSETKAAHLSTLLSAWTNNPEDFFDPAKNFPSILQQLAEALDYFADPASLAVLARFCAAALHSDVEAAKCYLPPSGLPQHLERCAASNPAAAEALQPHRDALAALASSPNQARIHYFYQARRTRTLGRDKPQLDAVETSQLGAFASGVYSLPSAQALLERWSEPAHRRICYITQIGLLTDHTFYTLWITKDNSRRRECAVFRSEQTTLLPLTLIDEKFVPLNGAAETLALAKACQEALVNAEPEDSLTASWKSHWNLDATASPAPDVLPSPAPGIPGAIRTSARAVSQVSPAAKAVTATAKAVKKVPTKAAGVAKVTPKAAKKVAPKATSPKKATATTSKPSKKVVNKTQASSKPSKKVVNKPQASSKPSKSVASKPQPSSKSSKTVASKPQPSSKSLKTTKPSTSKTTKARTKK